MKKLFPYILILLVMIGISTHFTYTHAEDALGTCYSNGNVYQNWTEKACSVNSISATWIGYYHFLAPLPCAGQASGCDTSTNTLGTFDPTQTNGIGVYLNLMIKIFIGICAVLSVIMIVMGGIEYMTSELISNKEHGKQKINNAIFGLLLALGAYTILYQINPDILNTDLNSFNNTDATVVVNLDSDVWQPTNTNGQYINKSLTYTPGEPWIDSATAKGRAGVPIPKETLLANYDATVYNPPECTTVGQASCTSTAGLDPSILQTIYNNCRYNGSGHCAVSIQGGTEFWAHGGVTGQTTHGIGSPTVDLGVTDGLSTYIRTGTPDPKDSNRWTKDGFGYFFEGNHWHAYRK